MDKNSRLTGPALFRRANLGCRRLGASQADQSVPCSLPRRQVRAALPSGVHLTGRTAAPVAAQR